MPQIEQLSLVYQSQLFWLLIVLAVIYFVVGRGIVPKVEATIDQRDTKISEDLAAAERQRAEADEAEDAWRRKLAEGRAQAQALVAEAREKAAKDAARRVKAADTRLAKKIAKASADIEAARAAALAEIEDVASEAAQSIVSKLVGVDVDRSEAKKAVADALRGELNHA